MAIRRHGVINGFWGFDSITKENTGVNGTSRPQFFGFAVDQIALFVQADMPTDITVQVAHTPALTSDGVNPSDVPTNWGDLYYINTGTAVTMSMVSGTRVLIIPDFVPGWVRLKSSNDVGCLAGWETVVH